MSTFEKRITSVLVDGLAELIRQGKGRNYWCSSRATADALIALDHGLPIGEYPHLRQGALRELLRESDVAASLRNWNAEVWDTSVALLALRNLQGPKYRTAILQSRDWLLSKYLKSHFWNHEPWETLWALIALSRLPDPPTHIDFSPAVEWILDAIGKPKGMLMNWSNTALFVLFTNRASKYAEPFKDHIAETRKEALETILKEPLDGDEALWTPEGWSNGLVLWAVAEANYKMPNKANAEKILNWCESRILKSELVEEDLAFTCIGLYEYLKQVYFDDSRGKELELKVELAKQLRMTVNDKPKVVTRHTYDGYFSIHLREGMLRFAGIILISLVLSVAALAAENKIGEWTNWIALVPALLGVIVGIADFRQMLPWNRDRKSTDEPNQAE